MRRFLLIAAAVTGARAQLTEFSSHIVLTGFDVERFNRPSLEGCFARETGRAAHMDLTQR